jgi:hypothetical protein
MRVPTGGSCCANCVYQSPLHTTCANPDYVKSSYKKGKRSGDDRFIDGKTGRIVHDPTSFCCNVYDSELPEARPTRSRAKLSIVPG